METQKQKRGYVLLNKNLQIAIKLTDYFGNLLIEETGNWKSVGQIKKYCKQKRQGSGRCYLTISQENGYEKKMGLNL